MASPSWPGAVNQIVTQDGFTEGAERNVISFQPEVGLSIDRRRTSVSSTVFSFTSWMTSAEWTALKVFYRSTLLDGTLNFIRNHPRTGSSGTFKFTDMPKVTAIRARTLTVSMSMRLISQSGNADFSTADNSQLIAVLAL